MIVYGHQSSAADGSYFMQNSYHFTSPSTRHFAGHQQEDKLASSAAGQPPPLLQHHRQQHQQLLPPPLLPPLPPPHHQLPPLPQLLPPPPKLKFQGVVGDMRGGVGCCTEVLQTDQCPGDCDMPDAPSHTAAESSSGFLYSLLTAQDASAVQQCSAFLGGSADQFPRRSQSVSVPARRGSAFLPATCQGPQAAAMGQALPRSNQQHSRPSSAPRGLRGPQGGGSAPALTSEEPLDLSGACGIRPPQLMPQQDCGVSIIEQQLYFQQQQQQQFKLQQLHRLQKLQQLHEQEQQQLQLKAQEQQLHQHQHQHQPMLRNMLCAGAPFPMVPPSQLSPRQQHQQKQQKQQQEPQQQQPVQLAKKTVPVAQSHVADWLKKGTELVRKNGALFGALEATHRSSLLCRAWPRILQLYMLENNFQFAVSPAHFPEAAAAAAAQDAGSLASTTQPTLGFAEDLQRLITSASVLPFDNITYNLLRLAAIFIAEQQAQLVEVHSEIMKHIYSHLRMKNMAELYNEAVALLHAVSQTDKPMLENLFCRHLNGVSVDDYIRSQLA